MSQPPQQKICAHYEACFREHGDTPQGVDWPNEEDAKTRYQIMLDVARHRPVGQPATLLDFGCGTGALLEYMYEAGVHDLEYSGLDLSEAFVKAASAKHPDHQFHCLDVLTSASDLPMHDYIVMNGVFTEKLELSYEDMLDYMARMLDVVFQKCRIGMAFNVMSKHVDWERDDLFHVPFDTMATLLKKNLSRHMSFRLDYGLYEYTVHLYHKPTPALVGNA